MNELFEVPLTLIHPTQVAVGEREVVTKHSMLSGLSTDELHDYLLAHPVPVVAGPGGFWFAVDRHHLGCAADRLGVGKMYCLIHGEVEWNDEVSFWAALDENGWCYPYDQTGARCGSTAIPRRFSEMADDPYRSLAGAARYRGAYLKTKAPFSEFAWANYFRRVVDAGLLRSNFEEALQIAVYAASKPEARGLPGFVEQTKESA